jgi:hypothetical protein
MGFSAIFAHAEEDLFSALDSSLPVSEISLAPSEDEEFFVPDFIANDPDVQIVDFYRRRRPSEEKKIPEPEDGERLMWKLGDTIRDLNIPTGEYSIIRVKDREKGLHIRFVGKLYSDGKHSKIIETRNEIFPGDYIVKENFQAISLPVVTNDGGIAAGIAGSLGKVYPFIEPNQDESMLFSGSRGLAGAKFKEYTGGNSTTLGATFVIRRKGEEIAKAIVVDTDLDLATFYIYESIREVKDDDEIFSQ